MKAGRLWAMFFCSILVGSAIAAQESDDLTELSLDELLDLSASTGVLETHRHFSGEWMISYKTMYMSMRGNRSGSDRKSPEEVLLRFPVTPLEMSMEMHMLGVMYAPSDRWTVMGMVPFVRLEMDHLTRTGVEFTTRSEGLGDVKLGAVFTALDKGPHRLLISGKIAAPTGSTDERGTTPAGPGQKLPYPMQLGSGTWDLLPVVSYLRQGHTWSFGTEVGGVLRTGTNDENYTLGDRLENRVWVSRAFGESAALTLGLDFADQGNISGADPELNPRMVPTADPVLRGGRRIDLRFGLLVAATQGQGSEGLRFALEIATPIHQLLDGPQLETDWILRGGVQWTF